VLSLGSGAFNASIGRQNGKFIGANPQFWQPLTGIVLDLSMNNCRAAYLSTNMAAIQ
jgi:hypothetical protein